MGEITTQRVEPRDVLEGAIAADLRLVIVIGRDIDGELYIASSEGDAASILWELETAKQTTFEAAE